MDKEYIRQQWSTATPDLVVRLLPLLSTFAGGLFLVVAWFLYSGTEDTAAIQWFQWIRLALIVLAGIFCFIAAALFVVRKTAGWDVLLGAAVLVPIILVVGLIFAAITILANAGSRIAGSAGHLTDGKILDLITANPAAIAIGAFILAIVILAALIDTGKSKVPPGEKK